MKVLKKPAVVLCVGEGVGWQDTVVGLLASQCEWLNLSERVAEEDRFGEVMDELSVLVQAKLGGATEAVVKTTEPASERSAVPKVGDLVIAHHVGENYYNAKVIAYDVSSHEYTVKWDDGDTSATCQPFERVSLDRTPDENDVGVGTIVLFTQGERCARTCKRARHAAACDGQSATRRYAAHALAAARN